MGVWLVLVAVVTICVGAIVEHERASGALGSRVPDTSTPGGPARD